MSEKAIILQMLNKAYKVEKKGIDLFSKLALESTTSSVKRLFQRLADDEEEHARIISKLISYAKQSTDWSFEYNESFRQVGLAVVSDFPDIDPFQDSRVLEVGEKVSLRESLKIAFELEKKQYQFFKDMIDHFIDPEAKKIVIYMANEERGHALSIAEEYNRLLAELKRRAK